MELPRKQLIIVIHYLEIGGAEASLLGLLGAVDYSQYDVDLFVYSHRGELMAKIPQQVNLLPEIPLYAQIERPMKEVLKDGYLRMVMARLRAKMQFAGYCRRKNLTDGSAIFSYVSKNVTPLLPLINPEKEYDLAISFLAPHDIVLNKVRARKKACWVHTDYSWIDIDENLELPVWDGYDHIVTVSEAVSDAFAARFPSLKGKMVTIENILSPSVVKSQADAFIVEDEMPEKEGITRLLSVGRFTAAKNYDNVPDICRRITTAGIPAKWYIIGFGGDEALIRQRIIDAGMEKNVILLGKRANPYPYFKACDIYVQPSRFEGNAVTVREAQMLGKPVVITDYATARDQVIDGEDGVIVPLDNEGCADGIARFIQDISLRSKISSNLISLDRSNSSAIEKVYALL
jgi:glycosyltransferase involved in cell wall biosynthesis